MFGFHDQGITHPKNLICLVFKRYIWVTKFRDCHLTIHGLKSLLKSYVVDLKYRFRVKKEMIKFNEWNAINTDLQI